MDQQCTNINICIAEQSKALVYINMMNRFSHNVTHSNNSKAVQLSNEYNSFALLFEQAFYYAWLCNLGCKRSSCKLGLLHDVSANVEVTYHSEQ